jgi:hypothetical protein
MEKWETASSDVNLQICWMGQIMVITWGSTHSKSEAGIPFICGKFSLLEMSKGFFGDHRRGVQGCQDRVVGDAGATIKSSAIRVMGEKFICVHLMVTVLNGHWGEDATGAAFVLTPVMNMKSLPEGIGQGAVIGSGWMAKLLPAQAAPQVLRTSPNRWVRKFGGGKEGESGE